MDELRPDTYKDRWEGLKEWLMAKWMETERDDPERRGLAEVSIEMDTLEKRFGVEE